MTYIEKEPIIEFITNGLNNPDKANAFGHDAVEILAEIEYAPTADVVEVVRCRKCKHHYWEQEACHGKTEHFCSRLNMQVFADFHCSYGERRDT